MAIDFEKLKSAATPHHNALIRILFPHGKLKGNEFRVGDLAGNPAKGDGSVSFNLVSGLWSEFNGSASGNDIISLWAAAKKITQGEAAKEISEIIGGSFSTKKSDTPKSSPAFEFMKPPSYPEQVVHPTHGKPDVIYEYRDKKDNLINLICRWNGDGDKTFAPYTYGKMLKGGEGWYWKQIPGDDRPLYGLQDMEEKGVSGVIVVEGEKAADAARAALKNYAVIAWSGGVQAWKKHDWTPLFKSKIILWPDADAPGIDAMNALGNYLFENLEIRKGSVRIVDISGLSPKWDAADQVEQHGAESVLQFLKQRAKDFEPDIHDDVEGGVHQAMHTEDSLKQMDAKEIRALGFDSDEYFFYSRVRKGVVSLKPRDITEGGCLMLENLAYWASRYMPVADDGGKSKAKKPDWSIARDHLMTMCHNRGVYNPRICRKTGAWSDDGRLVVHMGSKLVVDGKPSALEIDSKYIYEQGIAKQFTPSKTLSNEEAQEYIALVRKLSWRQEFYAHLFAGWAVVCVIGGALKWRPNIWLTGPHGTGKSWIVNNILRPITADFSFFFEGKTTESGVRNSINKTSLPVIYDEAEGQDAQSTRGIQALLETVRTSSTGSGAPIAQGKSGGGSINNFWIKSAFCMASINAQIKKAQDISRFTVLELEAPILDTEEKRRKEVERKDDISRHAADLLTEDYCQSFVARTISNYPVIMKNAMTFAKAWESVTGSRRGGDQIGTMLAGALSLYNNKIYTLEAAIERIKQIDDTEGEYTMEPNAYIAECWEHLMDYRIRIDYERGGCTRTIGQAIRAVFDIMTPDEHLPKDAVLTALESYGIKLDYSQGHSETQWQYVLIATRSAGLARIFSNTQWEAPRAWCQALKRMDAATQYSKPHRFSGSGPTRVVCIDWAKATEEQKSVEIGL